MCTRSRPLVGPQTLPEPHSHDLCEFRAGRLTVPRGWDVVRHEIDLEDSDPTGDDLLAWPTPFAGRPSRAAA